MTHYQYWQEALWRLEIGNEILKQAPFNPFLRIKFRAYIKLGFEAWWTVGAKPLKTHYLRPILFCKLFLLYICNVFCCAARLSQAGISWTCEDVCVFQCDNISISAVRHIFCTDMALGYCLLAYTLRYNKNFSGCNGVVWDSSSRQGISEWKIKWEIKCDNVMARWSSSASQWQL